MPPRGTSLLILAILLFGSPGSCSERVLLKMRGRHARPEMALSATGRARAKTLKPAFNCANKALAAKIGLDRWFVAETGGNAAESSAALRREAAVEAAEPVGQVHLALTPNDTLFGNQWALSNSGSPYGVAGADIRAPQAWDITTGPTSLVVAVIDTGIDLTHPEFAGRIVPGFNFVSNTTNANDDHGHGTSCAGIVGAAGNNNALIAGIAWNCRLMPVKVVASNGNGDDLWLAQGVTWAVDHGAKVISMSLIMDSPDQAVAESVQYAFESGVTIAAAMGNDSSDRIRYPAAIASVIAVGATTRNDTRAGFSNYGPHIDVVAPGLDVLTTAKGGGTANFSGTSAATPHVAGICALMLDLNPSLTPTEIEQIIRQGADDLPPFGFDEYTGTGRANAYTTLLALQDPTPPTSPIVYDSGLYTSDPSSLSFSWAASSDPESGVTGYEYAIGTPGSPTSVRNWANAGAGTSYTATGLALSTAVTYVISVRAVSSVHARSEPGVSDGIIWAPPVSSVGLTRAMANGTYVTIVARTATACFPNRFWITDPGRGAAIAVDGLASVGQGEIVTVSGHLETEGCLRMLKDAQVLVLSASTAPAPLGMNQATLGGESFGSSIAGITGGLGLNNMGSLVRVWGYVHNSSAQDFYLDDGTGLTGFAGQQGVRVVSGGMVAPSDGTFLQVTGILECETQDGVTKPIVRIRSELDVVSDH